MHEEIKKEWEDAVGQIVDSDHKQKIVVAGPGAGKTTLFKKLLEKSRNSKQDSSHLVVSFINDLVNELDRDLSHLADVFTFHSYCKQLLHKNPNLREGLTEKFAVFPQLATLIKSDWSFCYPNIEVPQFVKLMRSTTRDSAWSFFLNQSNYYDAVSFDDMIFRVYSKLLTAPHNAERYDMILVDEYQDFNMMEVSLIDILAQKSPLVIAGDDDQVLYGSFRGSSWNFIRSLYESPEYYKGRLPFCLRCPEAIIKAFDNIVSTATTLGLLGGRIQKPFQYFPPYKEADSIQHPKLQIIKTSIQKLGTGNYFGKAILKILHSIPHEDITKSREDGYPTVLIIGNKQYLKQISACLKENGYVLDEKEAMDDFDKINIIDGLRILKESPLSSLGWRIVLEVDRPKFFIDDASKILQSNRPLSDFIPEDYRTSIIAKADIVEDEPEKVKLPTPADGQPTIKLTSFQGAKGLSAQYVVIAGLHNGDLPKNPERIDDIEICKFLVALTRTRKRCYILTTYRFAGVPKQASKFLTWIDGSLKESSYLNSESV